MATFVGKGMGSGRQANAGRRSSSLSATTALNQNTLRGYRTAFSVTSKIRHPGPIDVSRVTRAGRLYAHLLDWVYNRIHVNRVQIDFGSIVTTQEAEVVVWNSFFAPRTLTSLELDADSGVTVEGPEPPHIFGPLADELYTIFVGPEGEPELDSLVSWHFGSATSFVRLTGSRVLFWGFLPNWDAGVNERLEWVTDVMASPLGVEQRRSLRLAPRRSFEVQLIAIPSERAFLDLLCMNWGLRRWAIPIWPDIQKIVVPLEEGVTFIPCKTEGRDFREGGLLGLRGNDAMTYEIATIEQVQPGGVLLSRPLQKDWPYGTRLYPVRTAQFMEQPETSRLTNTIGQMRATFLLAEPSDFAEAPPLFIYREKPVFTQRPEESRDLTYTYQRLVDIVDNTTGDRRLHDTARLGFTAQGHTWQMRDRDAQVEMRGLWYYLRGRQRSVWVPTHNDDLQLMLDVEPGANAINCKWTGYTRYAAGTPAKRDILVTLRDGRQLARRITSSTEEGELERLVLDEALDNEGAIRPRDVERISYLALSRLDQDFIDIRHEVDSEGLATASGVWRSLRDDIGTV